MRFGNNTLESRIENIRRDLDEIKQAQTTSQNSGLMGKIVGALEFDDFGDIVDFSHSSNPNVQHISKIPLPNTGSLNAGHTLSCVQTFTPKHGKPAFAVPIIELEVKTNGYRGKSVYFVDVGGWGVKMDVYNSANTLVATVQIAASFGGLFAPIYSASDFYTYRTNLTISSIVSGLELSYKFTVRSSDSGYTKSVLSGTW